jgi:hypothetical protein
MGPSIETTLSILIVSFVTGWGATWPRCMSVSIPVQGVYRVYFEGSAGHLGQQLEIRFVSCLYFGAQRFH